MVTVGAKNTVVTGVRGSVTLNGNLYAACSNFEATWGNEQEENEVSGTDIPVITTGKFHGEIDMTVLYSTESSAQFATLLTPTSQQYVAPINLIWSGKDTAGTTKTFTLTTAFWPKQTKYTQAGTKVVQAKISGTLDARPTLT